MCEPAGALPGAGDSPALAGLDLQPDDWAALTKQGFVVAEHRGEKVYHKLRFRRGTRQVVRCLADAEQAEAVQRELDDLQHETRALRQLRKLSQLARQKIRNSRDRLAPLVKANGWRWHGLAIRRPRRGS
jgi:hypothetical protein